MSLFEFSHVQMIIRRDDCAPFLSLFADFNSFLKMNTMIDIIRSRKQNFQTFKEGRELKSAMVQGKEVNTKGQFEVNFEMMKNKTRSHFLFFLTYQKTLI